MFLELSFDSRARDKEVSTSKDASKWRYEDKEEMSLDELISDFQQSATSRRSKLRQSVSSSNSSPVRAISPPKLPKGKESKTKSRSFSARARAVKQEPKSKPVKPTVKNGRHDDLSDDDVAVSPMPRLEQVLRNKPSFLPKRRVIVATSSQSRRAPIQQRKTKARSSVLSSPSLTPQSLSSLMSSSAESSSLSISEEIKAETPDEDSIDALIGKDIRDLNRLISTGSRRLRQSGGRARSPTTDEISTVIQQSTRFRRNKSNDQHSSLQLQLRGKPRSESPPPPPPPEDSEEEEDSFAEEIRKLRRSRRLSLVLPAKSPEKEALKDETSPKSSEICATAALKVRNASNAISELLLEALKPFGDKQREEEKALEGEESGAIRNAATAELQSATRTIVSQLDLAFADMTEQRKVDLKAEADAATAAKNAEMKEREAADEKKKAEEKETKEREMEVLRLIPMRGKLLTCSTDIEQVLTQLERADKEGQSDLGAEIKALRNVTQLKIQEIESRMSTKASNQNHSDRNGGISWQAVDWMKDNVDMDPVAPSERSGDGLEATERVEAAPEESEGPFERVLQLQVLEKLDLTMLKLKHVLAIDRKEAAEAKEKEQQEQEEEARKLTKQNLEDERKKLELEDAMNARRRVMGLTSVDEVEGWVEEGRQLRDEVGYERSLNRLLTSMESCTSPQNQKNRFTSSESFLSKQEEALRQFDCLNNAMVTANPATENKPCLRRKEVKPTHSFVKPRWVEIACGPSDSESDGDNSRDGFDGDISSPSLRIDRHEEKQQADRNVYHRGRRSFNSSPPRRPQEMLSSSHESRGRRYYAEAYRDKDFLKERRDKILSKTCGRGSRHQQEVARTIQALQVERRQKATWIRSRVWSPSTGRYPLY